MATKIISVDGIEMSSWAVEIHGARAFHFGTYTHCNEARGKIGIVSWVEQSLLCAMPPYSAVVVMALFGCGGGDGLVTHGLVAFWEAG